MKRIVQLDTEEIATAIRSKVLGVKNRDSVEIVFHAKLDNADKIVALSAILSTETETPEESDDSDNDDITIAKGSIQL